MIGLAAGCAEPDPEGAPTIHGAPGCPDVLEPGVHGPYLGMGDAMSICVIDADTRQPVVGIPVWLDGNRSGLTGPDGRADFPGGGSRAVTVGDPSGSQVSWFGFEGAQWIIAYESDAAGPASVTGTIAGWTSLPEPAPGHYLVADVTYTRRVDPTYRKNALDQAIVDGVPQNRCHRDPGPAAACEWTLTTRPGRQRILATILDADSAGTTSTGDDVYTVIGYADSGTITLAAGEARTGVALDRVPDDELQTASIEPIAELEDPRPLRGELALDLGADGVFVAAFPPLVPGGPPRPFPINAGRFAGRYDVSLYAGDDASYAFRLSLDASLTGGHGVSGYSMEITDCGHGCWQMMGGAADLTFATFRRTDGTSWSVFQTEYSLGRILFPPGLDVIGEGPVDVTARSVWFDYRLDTADFVLEELLTTPHDAFGGHQGSGARRTFAP